VLCEGTGEANRAVDVALGTGLPDRRPRNDPGEEDIGTGRGLEEDSPSLGVDIVKPVLERYSCRGTGVSYLMITVAVEKGSSVAAAGLEFGLE
jgi:hypothetical protein